MGSQKKYLGHSGRSIGFATSFKIIQKLVVFFTSYGSKVNVWDTQNGPKAL